STLSGINLQTDNYFQYTSPSVFGYQKTPLRLHQNTSTFELKRTYVLSKTPLRFKSNVKAFLKSVQSSFKMS
ncbi:hypothetical protein, partial [Phocaeicola plebeius]|uniref:hypothetical protein n=1 Tax=Phocaeicola plebeius TaxID=310297 RepID=UPI0040298A6B